VCVGVIVKQAFIKQVYRKNLFVLVRYHA